MSVTENISFGLKQQKMEPDMIERKVKHALELVDLGDFGKRSVTTLSGGQQQRIAIARALVNEPEILLLDEPLGALDLKMRQEMQTELKDMHEELGITFIYVTHDQEEALTMSDKIVILSDGKVQQIGAPEDIYNKPVNAFVADFIGESNIFNGVMTGKKKAHFCGGVFKCETNIPEGKAITAVVRPEVIEIVKPHKGIITGVVDDGGFKGTHYEGTVESGKYEIAINSLRSVKEGEEVGLNVDPEDIHVMTEEYDTNFFTAGLNRNHRLEYNRRELDVDVTTIFKGSRRRLEDGAILDEDGSEIDPQSRKVMVAIEPEDIVMTDNADEGIVQGKIIDLIYKGDHYSYVIDTDLGNDFFVDTEDLWNIGDRVGLILPVEKMRFHVWE